MVQCVEVAGLDVARLAVIITRRIELARRADGAVPWLDEAARGSSACMATICALS
jgi:hypothetical protein